jgi:hypothetical protein
MGVVDSLKNIGNYFRRRWRSTDPGSYDQYRRGRERSRTDAAQGRDNAEHHAERERREAERERQYDERYRAERASEEPRSEEPRGETEPPTTPP